MVQQPWPVWLDDVWAKSAEKGAGGQPETLAAHTWDVLTRLADLVRLRPDLPGAVGAPQLWQILYRAAFLHDFGKAARGFQARLRPGGKAWPHRHEVLSLAFVDWVAADLSTEDRAWLIAAIVSHHKDADEIAGSYRPPDDPEEDQLVALVAELDDGVLDGLWRWLMECGATWIAQLGLTPYGVTGAPLPGQPQALITVQRQGPARIYAALKLYRQLVRKWTQGEDQNAMLIGLILRGHIMNADHSASAHGGVLPEPNFDAKHIIETCKLAPEDLYAYQQQAWRSRGSALLTAPTGTGKTEAALLWAACQAEGSPALPRLFYTLPYQASMNAMKLRLEKSFGESNVGLQHGRALLALYRLLMQKDEAAPAADQARWALNLARLNYPPVRVFSPYQMLKGMYRLKGYEALLTDYHGAAFIFDEIHAYEVKRLALILKTIEYLERRYNARFLVMSATFPSLVKEWLSAVLPGATEIEADAGLFAQFRRHRLHLRDGELLADESLARIAADAQAGKTVLVVCNIVKRAQAVYERLQELLVGTDIPILLLHGRFNMRDRSAKEQRVREAVAADQVRRDPLVLVATQAVEVSLDIDLDTIYTEPAPLEALVQRFGRINRRNRQPELAPVYVFRQPNDGQSIYDPLLIARTLAILEREKARPIDESAIGGWLDEIYSGELKERWQAEYTRAADEFEATCVRTLRPFASDDGLQREFYQAFDSIEVLPAALHTEFMALQKENPILAHELLVAMPWGSYCGLAKKGLVLAQEKDAKAWLPPIVTAPYSEELGLTTNPRAAGDFD